MGKYIALIKIEFKNSFAYRLSTVASIVVGIIQIFVYYFIWSNVYVEKEVLNGYSFKQITTYVILSNVLYKYFEFGITLKISDMIKSGEISLRMTRPIYFIKSLFFESIGELASSSITLILPVFVVSVCFLPFVFPCNLASMLLFLVSILIGIGLSVYVDIAFGLLAFWTENGWGLRVIRQALIKLFSGAIVPMAFLPKWFANICKLLPFKYLIDTPINVYIYGVNRAAVISIIIQTIWLMVFVIFVNVLFKTIAKQLQVNGG
ncbi:MAG: ABC-2 family transporter protein [Lachnospiraceae bacterium]|nr:ABC-2 family transporter protein [Lachnospiraceae bacterium]